MLVTPVSASEDNPFQRLQSQLKDHPAVQAIQEQVQGVRYTAQGQLGLPNPGITLGVNNVPVSTPTRFDRFLPSNKSIGVTQRFPNFSGREARQQTGLAQAQLKQVELWTIWAGLKQKLIVALAQKQRIRRSLKALDEQFVKLDELEHWLKGEMESGRAVYGKVEGLDVQRAQLQEKRIALQGQASRWGATLQRLVQQDSDLKPPQLTLAPWVQERIPLEVLKAQQAIAIAQSKVKARKAAFNPDYGISAVWQQRDNDGPFEGDDWYSLKATITVPLWAEQNQRPKLKGAKRALAAARMAKDDAWRTSRALFDEALAGYQTSQRMIEALKRRDGELMDLETAMRRRYEAGEMDLEAVIRPSIQRSALKIEQAKQHSKSVVAAARANSLYKEFITP
ncbi:TolC family protein [Magnetococcus sp. PR-3]|uniref:TolC family protein n=1 Tax=Magnetococcus sp. PR-3 TaxID=3120355 RepID=UPI002FCE0973